MTKFVERLSKKNAFLLFLPLLVLYLGFIGLIGQGELQGDEPRYLYFARNLLQGFYSESDPYKLNLWNGPGYPLLLSPLVGLGLPVLCLRLLNGFFLYLSAVFFFKALTPRIERPKALIAAASLGLYLPFFLDMGLVLTETFSVLLVTLCIYFLGLSKRLPLAFCLAFLALTKVIFGYVLLVALALTGLFYLLKKSTPTRTMLQVYAIALLVCMPYLGYTYALTGKVFYWANSGGSQLYWMTSPHAREFGDWNPNDLRQNPELEKNHKEFFDSIASLPAIAHDSALKERALENIRNHPGKYVQNWIANIGRMLFSYPYSYGRHDPIALFDFAYIIPNAFLFVFACIFLLPTLLMRNSLPLELQTFLPFAAVYLGGSSLVSAYGRQFTVIVPILLFWIAYMLETCVRWEKPLKRSRRA